MCNYLRCGTGRADGNQDRFEAGVFAGYDLPEAMREYLKLSIDAAIASTNPLIRALASLDRRAGTRRLMRLDKKTENKFVTELLRFRRAAAVASESM